MFTLKDKNALVCGSSHGIGQACAAEIAKLGGDTVGIFNGVEWTPPNLTTNIDDAVAIIKTWQGGPVVAPVGNVAHLSVADVDPGDINTVVNFNDVFIVILAFQGNQYPFGPANADGNCP